jgi:hypothetical protein
MQEYICSKLTELAYGIDREFVNSVIAFLYKCIEPCRVAFIGDYSNDDECDWFWNKQHDFIWHWAWDELNIRRKIPKGYNEFTVVFNKNITKGGL